MQVPPELTYNQLQTKAFFSVFKQWPIQPISNGGQYWPGQVIRIYLNALTQGVLDPYRSHIQITIDCDVTTLPVGLLQVDNSAQSFIQQLVITSRNRQYGALAAYLTDIGISEFYAEGKQVEGLGYSNIDNYSTIYNSTSTPNASLNFDFSTSVAQATHSSGTIFPTIPTKHSFMSGWANALYANSQLSGVFRGHLNWLNSCWLSQVAEVWWWLDAMNSAVTPPGPVDLFTRFASVQAYGYVNNIRAQYLANNLCTDYVDSTTSLSKYQLHLQPSVQNGTFPAKFTNQTIYGAYIPNVVPYYYGDEITQTQYMYKIPNDVSLTGFTNLFSPLFAKGVRQPFISPTVPQCQMANGVILPQKIPVLQRTFKIPLISAVIGLLIPQTQFVLLPLRTLNDLYIQLTIDPSAMFTSGYNDIAQFDNVGMGLMQQRAFRVVRLVYNLHTYQFYTPQMDQYLKMNISSGIAINTQFWQLGNQYQIQNSQSITNSWQVACNQQALNQILTIFYPLDYQNFSFCRKHFRLSNNITKMQLRINMQYYPSQPLTGNGGNPVQLDSTGNNSIFLQQIFMTNGYMFSNSSPMPRINAYNFAINDRCYDITKTQSFYDISMIDNAGYVWNSDSINIDTAMGMPNLHQNRYVGKAAYVYSFQPYSHSRNFLTGIDCRAAKQFQIIFACNPQNWFPRPQMMLIYTRSSVIIEYGKQGIVNINK